MADGGGDGEHDRALRGALAWLASPLTVVAMVVLAVNDHVLKEAFPGAVTGKLSDLAGLVLAPALLAVVLAALRVPRPAGVALVATGCGFALVKCWQPATDVANHVWSTTGAWSTSILRDPTDLLALPALAVAGWASVRAARPATVRSRARLAVGAVVLPFAVLATAATSCGETEGIRSVTLVTGNFSGGATGIETRVAVGDAVLAADGTWSSLLVDVPAPVATPGPGETGPLVGRPAVGNSEGGYRVEMMCSQADPTRCWRIAGAGTAIESGGPGRPWRQEHVLAEQVVLDAREEHSSDCGGPAPTSFEDLAVLDTDAGPLVVVAASTAGVLVRGVDGTWERLPYGEPLSDADDTTTVTGTLRYRDPAPVVPEPPGPPPAPQPPPTTTCPSPTTVRVTPDPRNGPPTDVVGCPP